MKLIHEFESDYKVYVTDIEGYRCEVHKTSTSGCLVRVPFGDTEQEKKMFDDLVYRNKSKYWAWTPEEAVNKVTGFIKNYKHENF